MGSLRRRRSDGVRHDAALGDWLLRRAGWLREECRVGLGVRWAEYVGGGWVTDG